MLIPEAWSTGVLVPLLKNGNKADPGNYRPICMLSHVRKVIEKTVTTELEGELKADRMQFGFQRNINILQAAL